VNAGTRPIGESARVSDFDPDAPAVRLEFVRGAPSADARRLERRMRAGDAVRVRAGVAAEPTSWATTSAQRHRARILAAVRTRRREEVVLGYESAALLHGLPRLGPWPDEVSLIDDRGTRPASRRNGIRWHRESLDAGDIARIEGLLVTSLERTLVDVARSRGFAGATLALDHALHDAAAPAVLHDGLRTRIASLPGARGVRSARLAVAFADGRAQSPGESLSRARMHELGFLAPDLQVRMPRPDGPDDVVDFDWPEQGTFGEMDGVGKYVRTEYARGRAAAEVVIEEKIREDRIRRRHRPFCLRWGWAEALRPDLLARILAEGGIPRIHPPAPRRNGRFPT